MDMKLFALLVGYVQGVVGKVSNAVKSVNGKTGEVNLTATDVGAAVTARGLPTGGAVGDLLRKSGTGNYQCEWGMAWEAEQLAGNLYIYRQENMRFLLCNGANVADPVYTLKESDRPASDDSYFGLSGTTSSNRTACFMRVYRDGKVFFRTFSGAVISSGNGWGTAIWSTNAPTVQSNGG